MDPLEACRVARGTVTHLEQEGRLADKYLDALRRCLEMAEQREHLVEALARLRAREAELMEALRQYLAGHNAGTTSSCGCCAAARKALRR